LIIRPILVLKLQAGLEKSFFVNAAEALFDVMIEGKTDEASVKKQKKITVEGNDVADLLINFLRELLYLFNGEKFITVRFSLNCLLCSFLRISGSSV
jgi:SHS2 domain-containing protein